MKSSFASILALLVAAIGASPVAPLARRAQDFGPVTVEFSNSFTGVSQIVVVPTSNGINAGVATLLGGSASPLFDPEQGNLEATTATIKDDTHKFFCLLDRPAGLPTASDPEIKIFLLPNSPTADIGTKFGQAGSVIFMDTFEINCLPF
jgi:hypothetical protein